MTTKGTGVRKTSPRANVGTHVPMRAIRRFVRQVAERFEPDKIILFGSHAYGKPHGDSDVDILVVMPARREIDQAVKIRLAFPPPPFPMDLIVRTPAKLQRRIDEGNSFLKEVVAKGKVLYEKGNRRVGSKGRGRPQNRRGS